MPEFEASRHIVCTASATPATARERLRAAGADLAVVVDGDRPLAVVDDAWLTRLASESRPFLALADQLPALIRTHAGEQREIETAAIALAISDASAPGVLVYDHEKLVHAVLARSVRAALTPRALEAVLGNLRGGGELYGLSNVPAPQFVCCKCAPPTREFPRVGIPPPICPKNVSHGEMDQEYP